LTTWNNSDITRKTRLVKGNLNEYIYTIAGVSGDTGGTLTTHLNHLEAAYVHVQVSTPAGYATNLLHYLSGSTVVVAYTNPALGHTIRICATGK